MVTEERAAELVRSDGGKGNGARRDAHVEGHTSTEGGPASTHGCALDLLLDEESLLLDAFAVLRPGLGRLGPAAHVAAVALEHIAQVRLIRRGVEAEAGL